MILGKTVILRKKAILVKEHIDSQGYSSNEAPNVFYVVLTSCDQYGRPEFPVSFFDGATKRSLKEHSIQVITVHDLLLDFQQAYPDWDGISDPFKRSDKIYLAKNMRLAEIFEDCSKKVLEEMNLTEFMNKMDQNGINGQNAGHEVLTRRSNMECFIKSGIYEPYMDVYIMLFSFIERHRKDHFFVDEASILHSKFCKFNINLTFSD